MQRGAAAKYGIFAVYSAVYSGLQFVLHVWLTGIVMRVSNTQAADGFADNLSALMQ